MSTSVGFAFQPLCIESLALIPNNGIQANDAFESKVRKDRMLQLLNHLDAAYNLARWLTQNEHDAEDIVQEAYLRAIRHLGSFHGGEGRALLLTIVRNRCYDSARHKGVSLSPSVVSNSCSGILWPGTSSCYWRAARSGITYCV